MPFAPSKARRHARRSPREMSLQITSMIDIFTILLVFLLKSYSAEGHLISVAESISLPVSTAQQQIHRRITRARALLPQIDPPHSFCLAAARLALALEVHGHRADVLLVKAAATLAALDGRTELGAEDLTEAAEVVLPHRLRRQPFEEPTAARTDLAARAREALAAAPPGTEKKK